MDDKISINTLSFGIRKLRECFVYSVRSSISIAYNRFKCSFSVRRYRFLNNIDVLRTIFCFRTIFSIDIDCRSTKRSTELTPKSHAEADGKVNHLSFFYCYFYFLYRTPGGRMHPANPEPCSGSIITRYNSTLIRVVVCEYFTSPGYVSLHWGLFIVNSFGVEI